MLEKFGIMCKKTHRFTRINNINEHLKSIESEFVGSPDVCYQLISHIVNIRRQINVGTHYQKFIELLENQSEVLITNLNTRWLISVCDTYVDHGTNQEKANALVISTYVNMVKLADTYIYTLSDQSIDQSNFSTHGPDNELWDGITQYCMQAGDMFHNLNSRICLTLESTPIISQIWLNIFERMQKNKNLLSKVSSLYQGKDSFY